MTLKRATLALACGEVFEGLSVGAEGETTGEVVFNTCPRKIHPAKGLFRERE